LLGKSSWILMNNLKLLISLLGSFAHPQITSMKC